MKTATCIGFAAILLLAGAGPAHAWSSLRCNNGLVTEGSIKIEVLDRCGEPLAIEGNKYIGFHEGWVYEKANFYYILTFKGTRLVKIAPVMKTPSMKDMERRAALWR